jgi:transcriptional regulator with XRE-family HTH domain
MSPRRSVRPGEPLEGLPQRIITVRERLGLSQRAFAKRLGVSSGIVGRWERGAGMTAAMLGRIATAGGVTPEWLLRGTTADAPQRPGGEAWTEALAALEAVWREPARRRLVVRLLRALAAEAPNGR